MRLDETGRVTGLKSRRPRKNCPRPTDPAWLDGRASPAEATAWPARESTRSIVDARKLLKTDYCDFGKEIFPAAIRSSKVQVHLFDGYWEDIGTISAFYEANLGDQTSPLFELSVPAHFHPSTPPSRVDGRRDPRQLDATLSHSKERPLKTASSAALCYWRG